MHTVELLESALGVAELLGYRTRQEWLGGTGGGSCELQGQKWIFLDLADSPSEHLTQVIDALRSDPEILGVALPPELSCLVGRRKKAG